MPGRFDYASFKSVVGSRVVENGVRKELSQLRLMVERICYNQEKTNQNINIIKNTRCRSASIEVPDMKCLPVKNLSGLKQLERSLADSTTAKNYVMLPKTVWRHCVMLIFILQEVVIAYVGGSTKKEAVESAWKKTGDNSALRQTGLAEITIVEAILPSSGKFLYANQRLWTTWWVIKD